MTEEIKSKRSGLQAVCHYRSVVVGLAAVVVAVVAAAAAARIDG